MRQAFCFMAFFMAASAAHAADCVQQPRMFSGAAFYCDDGSAFTTDPDAVNAQQFHIINPADAPLSLRSDADLRQHP